MVVLKVVVLKSSSFHKGKKVHSLCNIQTCAKAVIYFPKLFKINKCQNLSCSTTDF